MPIYGVALLPRRCDVRAKYASRLGGYPSQMGAAPCIWTFLSSLGKNTFFNILRDSKVRR